MNHSDADNESVNVSFGRTFHVCPASVSVISGLSSDISGLTGLSSLSMQHQVGGHDTKMLGVLKSSYFARGLLSSIPTPRQVGGLNSFSTPRRVLTEGQKLALNDDDSQCVPSLRRSQSVLDLESPCVDAEFQIAPPIRRCQSVPDLKRVETQSKIAPPL